MNLPGYESLPAPYWLITILHIVTLTVHFLAMNFVLGGIIIVLWGKFTNRWEDPTVQRFIQLFPSAMAMTITFGIAPLLFLQLVYPKQVYSAAILSGWFWLGVIPAVIVAYVLLYDVSLSSKQANNGKRNGRLLSFALLAIVYVSFLYSSVFSLAERPELVEELYRDNQSGWLLNPMFSDYIMRWLHIIFGSITVAGFFVGVVGKDNPQAYQVGKFFFVGGMALASLSGFIYLFTLSDILIDFMRSPGIWALTVGIILSVGSLHFFFKKKFMVSGAMVVTSVLTMVISRHYVRLLKLSPGFDPSTLPVDSQWSVLAVFAVCFLLMVGLVIYMLRIFFCSKDNQVTTE